jgi:serine/threonine protein kinase
MISEAETPGLPFTKLAHYQIVAQIGSGGLGDVYRGYEESLDRTVAIKVLPPSLAAEPAVLKRFHLEAEAAARLEHPHIIQIYFVGEDQGRHFFAMEFIDGESLEQRLTNQERLIHPEALPILEQCLLGLQAAHDRGIVHRDIKPANILLDRKRHRAVLTEFCLAKSLESASRMTSTNLVLGTVDYLSPEQGRGMTVDARSDLYSVGIVAFRMLAGRLPFRAESPTDMIFQHAHVPPPELTQIAPEVPAALARIVHRLLAKSPAERYPSAAAAHADFQAFHAGRPLPSETPAAPSRSVLSRLIRQTLPSSPIVRRFRKMSAPVQLTLALGLFLVAAGILWNKYYLPRFSENDAALAAGTPFRSELTNAASPGVTATGVPPSSRNNVALLAAIDRAFDIPAAQLAPGVVVFPPTDPNRMVREEGAGLAMLAMISAAYAPQRRMRLDPHLAHHVLLEAGALEAGTHLDEPLIQQCRAAIGTELYVLTALEEVPGAWNMALALRGGGTRFPDRDVARRIEFERMPDVAGEITRALLDWIGIEANTAPAQVATNEGCATLSELLRQRHRPDATDGRLHGLTQRNRNCTLAWGLYLEGGPAAAGKLQWYKSWSRAAEHEYLTIGVARQERDQKQSPKALQSLLPLASTHHDDAWYYRELALCAMPLDDDGLIQRLLALWKQNATSYDGHLTRGMFLIDWAWSSVGGDYQAASVPRQEIFRQRLELARAELNSALALNPLDWLANTHLLRVAVGLGLPRKDFDEHFARATRFQSRNFEAYRHKFTYLQPRWHGKPAELLAFAQECAATGYWVEGIPQLVIEAINHLCFDPKTGRFDYGEMKLPEVWEAAQALYRNAGESGRPPDIQTSLNFLILCGARGGRAAELSRLLVGINPRRDDAIFPQRDEFDYASDLIAANAQPAVSLAAIRVALGESDLSGAEGLLAQNQNATYALLPEAERQCRAALRLGQNLAAHKTLSLSPADILETFMDAFPAYGREEGQRVVCHVLREAVALFPLGLRKGVISGTIDWSPELITVEILAHTRGERDPLHLIYLPQIDRVQLRRNKVLLQEASCPPGPHPFRLEFGDRIDRLEPLADVVWEIPVNEAGRSGFGFRGVAGNQAGTFSLSDLKIELRD